jgi:hypothetical protein
MLDIMTNEKLLCNKRRNKGKGSLKETKVVLFLSALW